jgi:phosphate transport system substrate-binding protein
MIDKVDSRFRSLSHRAPGGNRLFIYTILGTIAIFMTMDFSLAAARAEDLVVQGSTTFARRLMEPHQAAIEAASGHNLKVIPNKSSKGLLALLEKQADLAMISAPLENELQLLRDSNSNLPIDELRAFEISRTRVAVVVHASNSIRAMTLDEVQRILLGKVTNWKELGGPDSPIRIVVVGGGGGVTATVESVLLEGKSVVLPNMIQMRTPVQLVQVVKQERGAIGFAQLALTREHRLSELATDRPIEQILSLISLGEPTPALREVIEAARRVAAADLE